MSCALGEGPRSPVADSAVLSWRGSSPPADRTPLFLSVMESPWIVVPVEELAGAFAKLVLTGVLFDREGAGWVEVVSMQERGSGAWAESEHFVPEYSTRAFRIPESHAVMG